MKNKKIIAGLFIIPALLFSFSVTIVSADDEASTTSEVTIPETTAPETIHVNVSVRENDIVTFEGQVELEKGGTQSLTDTGGTSSNIGTDSALAALIKADNDSDSFAITNTTFYPAYNSFLVNCLHVNNGNPEEACFAWQYVVNNTYPFVGSDSYTLNDGDTVYFYFGSPRRLNVPVTTAYVNDIVGATAESYDYQNNLWIPLTGTTVGATQPDPNNPWSPLVPYSTTTDSSGIANLIIGIPGVYNFGLATDYYFPTTAVTILATATPAVIETNSNSNNNNNSQQSVSFDVIKAGQFLSSKQDSSGAISGDLYTDWSAIGLSSISDFGNEKTKIASYIKSHGTAGTWLPDYERHAMALLALGLDPRTTESTDYIAKITSQFDGTQFGDKNIFNDDIFALFPLIHSGYTSNNIEIRKAVEFILSKQSQNGSWMSVDVTSAAVQALSMVKDISGVSDALIKSRGYLSNSQNGDGGFGDVFATSWATQAITALGESPTSWVKNNKNPLDYLAINQESAGNTVGLDDNSRIWGTAYAIPAVLGKTWDSILSRFPKPTITNTTNTTNSGGGSTSAITTNTATSSVPMVLGAFTGPVTDKGEMLKAILAYLKMFAGLSPETIIFIN
jgi:hypothetical protein